MGKKEKLNEEQELFKEQVEEEKKARRILFSIVGVTILVLAVLGLSFATFQQEHKSGGSNSITTQNISMNYTESENGISIVNATPISDSVGKLLNGKGEYFDFTVTATLAGNAKVTYEIAAMKDKSSTISDDNIKLYLEQQVSGTYEETMAPKTYTPIKEDSQIGSPAGSMVLKTVNKDESGTDNYRLRMWIKENTSIDISQHYTVKVNVYGKAQ